MTTKEQRLADWQGAFCYAMKEYARTFYKSAAWLHTSAAYKKSVGGLCERCSARGLIAPGVIVHHKKYLTPENISDPSIALDWSNLECLCQTCHNQEHHGGGITRFEVDELGRVSAIP